MSTTAVFLQSVRTLLVCSRHEHRNVSRAAKTMNNIPDERELEILRILELNPSLNQRELAKVSGISLGKTNFLIRALLDKGWVKVKNFTNSDNKAAYLYLLTPEGIAGKVTLCRSYLGIKEEEYGHLQKQIELLKTEVMLAEVSDREELD